MSSAEYLNIGEDRNKQFEAVRKLSNIGLAEVLKADRGDIIASEEALRRINRNELIYKLLLMDGIE